MPVTGGKVRRDADDSCPRLCDDQGVDTLGRHLQLLALLQQRSSWTSEELADRLDVTTRTVRRDVARLRELGYLVEAEPGPYGGYRLAGGKALPPLALAEDEAVAVAVALRSAAGSGVAGVDEAALTALAKLEQILPGRLREQVGALNAVTERLGTSPPGAVDPAVLVALAHACRRREVVRCLHRSSRGEASRRELEPYRLVQARRRWYLAAFDRRRDDWRTFRVDRLAEVQPQGIRSGRRGELDAAALVARAITTVPYRWHATVRLQVPAERAAAYIPPTVGTVEADGEGALLHIGADELEWLSRYLVGLQVPFEVVEPPELRENLVDLGRTLAGQASRT